MLLILLKFVLAVVAFGIYFSMMGFTWWLSDRVYDRASYRTQLFLAWLWPITLPTVALVLICEKFLKDEK
jgi:NhaP-type Na+/H+ or K+/H+ antiporter